MGNIDPRLDSTWRNNPDLVAFKGRIEAYFSGLDEGQLASQLGAILEVELIESGQMPNDLSRNHNNVARSLALLLNGGLKPDEERTFLESDQTRIGREACVAEFLKRLFANNPQLGTLHV